MGAVCSPPQGPATVLAQREWVPCNLCGGVDATLLYPGTVDEAGDGLDTQEVFACTSSLYGRYGPVVRCRQCGLVYQNPRVASARVETAYEDVADRRYLEEREGRVYTFSRALGELERYADRGRLLDVGCHVGVFLEVALARGWIAEGVEPSRWASTYARERGLAVACGTLRECELPAGQYDVVTLWDVIEHFCDPAAELAEVHRLLRPGGLVGITTMNVESRVARLLGSRWPWLMQMHLYYFSVRTLTMLLERCGFETIAVAPHRRIVRLAYLLSRAERWAPGPARALQAVVGRLRLAQRLVPVDLGDIVTVYARRAAAPVIPLDTPWELAESRR
jgi:2-polyprenyl-3-methyl-5-hydroxy-6-metoxy-1,4-benzoquinol methylase